MPRTTTALASLTVLLALATAAPAQPASVSTQAVRFDVPAQPMESALTEFASQANLRIVFFPESVKGLTVHRLSGIYTPEDGLKQILGHTELVYRFTDPRTVSVTTAVSNSPIESDAYKTENTSLSVAQASTGPISDSPQNAEIFATNTKSESASAETEANNLEEVVVTGSRILRRGFDAPQPLTVIGADQIKNLNQTSVGEILTSVPQNSAFVTDNNVGLSNFNVGAELANLRGLNPYFGTRTLTLVDGKRFVPSTNGGAVDLNLIPSILVDRIEVVTGGASAVYGSDAVAGVVNVILDKSFEGIKAQLDDGRTEHGDGRTWHGALAAGTPIAAGRGHLLIGGEYERGEGIGACASTRNWCKTSVDLINNPRFNGPDANGLPNYIFGSNAKTAGTTYTGVLPFLGVQFNAAGTGLRPFDPGLYAPDFPLPFSSRVGGDGEEGPYTTIAIRPPVERYALYGRLDYDLTPAITASTELSYGERQSSNSQLSSGAYVLANIITPDNVFLPPDAAAAIAGSSDPLAGAFNRSTTNIIRQVNHTDDDTWRVVASLDGRLGGGWRWNGYLTYGKNRQSTDLSNVQVTPYFNYALDAIDDPRTPNIVDPVCRAVVEGNPDAQGCRPLNLFGLNNADPAALAYAYRTLSERFDYTQKVVAGSVTGNLFEGIGAGPFGIAFGAEHREEHGEVVHPVSPPYDLFSINFGGDFSGKVKVTEGFAEVNLPLLRDHAAARLLETDLAYRHTHTQDDNLATHVRGSNDADTWKLSVVYEPLEWLRVRATRSRDIRSPGFRELYFGQIQNPPAYGASVNNPALNNSADAAVIDSGGNPKLKPEKADTTTAGLVFSLDDGSSRARLSIDWFQVDISGAIGQIDSQTLVDSCYAGTGGCDKIVGTGAMPSPAGGTQFTDITAVNDEQTNVGSFVVRGFDFELSYTHPLWRSAFLNARVIGTYQYDTIVSNGEFAVNYAGETGPSVGQSFNSGPKLQSTLFLTYLQGPLTAVVTERYIGRGKYRAIYSAPGDPGYDPMNFNTITDNRVPDRLYTGLSIAYSFTHGGGKDGLELFGNIENVFDRDPPRAPGGNGYPTNPVYFDTAGRSFLVGLRVKL
jgi:iron complex outermembrane recepter protein